MLTELVQYQGKAGFLKLNFKNGISRNIASTNYRWVFAQTITHKL